MSIRLALKVDVDTDRGTREGVPNLVADLQAVKAPAAFLFSLGPDQTGRAITRVLRPGFFKKVSRTSVVQIYGVRTLLNGTLLPAPHIGRRNAEVMRAVRDAGFEIGIHCYNHYRWQDYVQTLPLAEVRGEFEAARAEFVRIFGAPPQADQNKAKEYEMEIVFAEIERISGVKHFISLYTFERTYCNPGSITIIPREKKVFKAICQYLELPLEYRAAMHRERNLIGGYSEEWRSKLKSLIVAMVNCEIFDQRRDDEELLEILNSSIDKIEKRVDIDFFGSTRESLIYACIAVYYEILEKIKLKPIIRIEHISSN